MHVTDQPCAALKLADEYKIGLWIRALLDPSPIDKSASDPKKSISPPPTYIVPESPSFHAPSDQSDSTPSKGSRGSGRSSSPSKIASPNKKTASPRKRATKAANAAHASAASATLQAALNNAATAAESGHAIKDGDVAKVEVDSNVKTNGEIETTHTNVKIDMPAGSKALPLPESTEEMLATAKKMVEEARRIEGKDGKGKSSTKVSKRKAEEAADSITAQPAKKTRTLEEQLKAERVKTRALIGLSATLAIG